MPTQNKRRRTPSSAPARASSRSSAAAAHHHRRNLPDDSLNPLSHPHDTIRQLRAAGLAETDALPSTHAPDFPHRPVQLEEEQQDEEDEEDDEDEPGGGGEAPARQKREAQDAQLAVLVNVVLRALGEGDVARARRAFGLVARSRVRGRPVDLRRRGLWSLGAEVLMREGDGGEETGAAGAGAGAAAAAAAGGGGGGGQGHCGRWGCAANLLPMRAYLEFLIRQYPYSRLRPNSTSALDFYAVLFSCEFHNVYAQHKLALERLRNPPSDAWSEHLDMAGMDMSDNDGVHNHNHNHNHNHRNDHDNPLQTVGDTVNQHTDSWTEGLREQKTKLGLHALASMRDIASRMDSLLENTPYSRSVELLRLRGMVALYIGDLSVPPPPRTPDEQAEGKRTRDREQGKARKFFACMRDNGGRVDASIEKCLGDWIESEDDHDMMTMRTGT